VMYGGATMPSAKDATRESNRVMTFSQWCERNSLSKITGWRILKAGDGCSGEP
jgi:hypothetical protein